MKKNRTYKKNFGSLHELFSELAREISPEIEITADESEELLQKKLAERETMILKSRFIEGLTLKDLGKKHGVTKGRILQIQDIALARLERSIQRLHDWKTKKLSEGTTEDDPKNALLLDSLDSLALSIRTVNALHNGGIETVGKLRQQTARDLLYTKGFGKKALAECREALRELDIVVDW